MSVFEYLDYKKYLKAWITQSSRGEVGRLSKAADCHPSYLSQVLTSNVQLTTDQGYLLSRHMEHTSSESSYFMTLIELQRSSKKVYQEFLKQKLQRLKQEGSGVANPKEEQIHREYYSTWLFQAIHIMTSIPKLRTEQAMASALGVSVERVLEVLNRLKFFGFVSLQGTQWSFVSSQNQLPPGSPFLNQLHHQWRDQAVSNSLEQSREDLHFTVIQTLSQNDFQIFQRELIALVGKFEELSNQSASEILINFNFDFYKVATAN